MGILPPEMDLPVNDQYKQNNEENRDWFSYSALVSVSGLGGTLSVPTPPSTPLSVRAGNKVAGRDKRFILGFVTLPGQDTGENGLNSPDTTEHYAGVSPPPHPPVPPVCFLAQNRCMPVQCSHPVATACSFPLITCLYLFLFSIS